MAAAEVIRSMRSRVPWTVAGQLLGAIGLQKSMGWRRTLSRVEAGELDYEDQYEALSDALEEHLISGEKLVRFFEVEDNAMAQLRLDVADLAIPGNAFSQAFPILLPEAALGAFGGHQPYLTAKVEYLTGTAVVLASARYLTTREAILPAELPDAAADELSEYEEIICVRHRRLEGIDVLWVPEDGNIIELRTDYPLGMHIRKGVTAAQQAQTRFQGMFGLAPFAAQLNLFPAIQGLYASVGEGRMVELGFMVSGSAQKLEKTRRDVECCREEAYHRGGVDALTTPIAPFRTSVLWEFPLAENVASEPEITLRGHSVQCADPDAFLGDMIVRNCVGIEDFAHVRDRVLALLSE